MSFADLMPVRIGFLDRRAPRTRHRRPDEIARLKFLLYGANLCIKGLHLRLDDKDRQHAEAIARIDARHAEVVRGLEGTIAELEHRLNVGVLAESVVTKTQELSLDEIRQHCVMPLHQAAHAGLLGPVTDPAGVHAEGVA